MHKNILLVATFFVLTPLALFASALSLLALTARSQPPKPQVLAYQTTKKTNGTHIYAALPEEPSTLEGVIKSGDARSEILKKYLTHYNSPLVPYADYIVHVSDEYGLDFRLTTAIAQQESNLCKKIPEGTYNCWGWGIHSEGTLGFGSYREGILKVSQGLKDAYLDEGYLVVEDIMRKYTPPSKGSWAEGVSLFMSQMQ